MRQNFDISWFHQLGPTQSFARKYLGHRSLNFSIPSALKMSSLINQQAAKSFLKKRAQILYLINRVEAAFATQKLDAPFVTSGSPAH
jgi:hypothetical protein